jgi:oligopeptidase B
MKKYFAILFLLSCGILASIEAPKAKIQPSEFIYHNEIFSDNYAWMKDKSRKNPEIIDYIQAENEYTQKMMHSTEKLQKKLFKEILSRQEEKEESLPLEMGEYHYYWRREKKQQYSNYYRKKSTPKAKEELLIDVNTMAKEYPFLDVSGIRLSPNHLFLAYLMDTAGTEEYTLQIKDLSNHTILPDKISPVSGITWANDNHTIFFTLEEDSGRANQVFRHKLGEDITKAELIFEETDGKFYAWTSRSRSNRFLFLGSGSKTTSEIWYLDADRPNDDFLLIEPRQQGMEYYVQHANDSFFITTNADDAYNFKVMKVSMEKPQRALWQEFIPHRDSVSISIDVFQNLLAIYERIKGNVQLRITDHENSINEVISFPEKVYSLYYQANPQYELKKYRFAYESYITPHTIYELNPVDFSLNVAKKRNVRGKYDKEEYATELHFAPAQDGTLIPISMVYKKNIASASSPLLLNAYGSYGDPSDPYFSASRLSLLDRGIIFATAHVRGGGELGRKWYDDGRLLNKKNTFTDFIDCAHYLIDNNFTAPQKLIIQGGSAGGLLIGAVINMRPDLFLAAIADVPFVDVLNTMFDPTLSAVESEYEEWGNPNEKEYFDYIRSYCPYQNVAAREYPHLLILAGYNDPRVSYWEPLKWIAKLRANKTDENLLLMKMNLASGHGGASGRDDYLKEIAFEYAFILQVLGIEK